MCLMIFTCVEKTVYELSDGKNNKRTNVQSRESAAMSMHQEEVFNHFVF